MVAFNPDIGVLLVSFYFIPEDLCALLVAFHFSPRYLELIIRHGLSVVRMLEGGIIIIVV
jgi:hypothetical protein